MGKLDGTEVAQPVVYTSSYATEQLQHFYRLAPLAAIGSSDYHGPGPLGLCRTYVFVKEVSEAGVLEAVRSHRTVVFDRGRVYGDPALIRLAGAQLPRQESISAAEKSLAALSRICAILGLLGIVAAGHASKAYRDLSPALQSRVGAGS